MHLRYCTVVIKRVARLHLRVGKLDRSSAEGALVEAPKAPRRVGCGKGVPSPPKEGLGRGPLLRDFFLFVLKMEHFSAVIKLYLTEETRTLLQVEEAIASS